MEKIGPNIENLPNVGYYINRKERMENIYKEETHIHKQNALSGAKAGFHKFSNDIFTYFPKGFQGSKNSDFYEFLSLGMVPYLIGSIMLIKSYLFGKKGINPQDALKMTDIAKNVGAGVALYAAGKWLSPKLSRTMLHATTGVNLNQLYINKVDELPEPGEEKGKVRIQYPGVFDSATFTRTDLIEKKCEIEEDNMHAEYNRLGKKAGFGDNMNASNQEMVKRLKEVKVRAQSMEYISKYATAALGVVIGNQKPFSKIQYRLPVGIKDFGALIAQFPKALAKSTADVWNNSKAGKGLIIASVGLTLLDWLVPMIGFKHHKNTMQSKIDNKKESEVC